jgi:hypothetical protein
MVTKTPSWVEVSDVLWFSDRTRFLDGHVITLDSLDLERLDMSSFTRDSQAPRLDIDTFNILARRYQTAQIRPDDMPVQRAAKVAVLSGAIRNDGSFLPGRYEHVRAGLEGFRAYHLGAHTVGKEDMRGHPGNQRLAGLARFYRDVVAQEDAPLGKRFWDATADLLEFHGRDGDRFDVDRLKVDE